jgi:adenylate cyclase
MARSFLPESIKRRIPAIIAIVLTVVFLALASNHLDLADKSFLTILEYKLMDWRFRVRGQQPPGNEVMIVALDEKTLGKLGTARTLRREAMADLITKVGGGGPKAIGFDILYPEPDETHPQDDQKLAAAIQAAGNVVMGAHLDLESTSGIRIGNDDLTPELKKIVIEKQVFPAEQNYGDVTIDAMFNGRNLELPIPALTSAGLSFGFTNFHKADGQLRYQPQLIEYQGHLYPSLDLQIVRHFLDAPSPVVQIKDGRIDQRIDIGPHAIPTDQFGRLLLNFDGERGIHQTVSMIDVLEGRIASQAFTDKIVLIGATAVALFDSITTPFEEVLPGIELHANVIDSILHERYLYRNGWAKMVDLATIVLFGFVAGYFLPKFNASRSVMYSGLMFAAFIGFNLWAFIRLHLILSLVYPGLSLLMTAAALISYKYYTEEREKKRTKSTFQHYLDPHVVNQVVDRPEMLKLGGEKREMTVLFSDIRGFTSFSEKMAPAEVVHFLNQYFNKMQGLIFQHKGTLDKLIGDAVMCFWNHPLDIKDHAVRGVITALEMIQAVEELRSVLVLPGGAKFEIGIGVNTGPMIVGNMGSDKRLSYTVMGDNVNLGSRLESLNKFYGTKVIISDTTFQAVEPLVLCRQLDTIQVKGKSQAVTIYEPFGLKRLEFERRKADRRGSMTLGKQIKKTLILLGYGERRQEERRVGSARVLSNPEQKEIATMYEHALALYRKGDFDAAEMGFDHVLTLKPGDGPSRLMKTRIAKYRIEYRDPETHFDPVYKFDEK